LTRAFDALDHRYLRCIAVNYGGGPVGIETSPRRCRSRDAIEEIIEPPFVAAGLHRAHAARRVLTQGAFAHLGLQVPERPAQFGLSTAATNDERQVADLAGRIEARPMSCRSASIMGTLISPATSITPIT
jgi:hypothetical protein